MPFYKLYECRYQIYFPLYSSAEWNEKQEKIAAAEKERMALEAQTVDKVYCGEQQSESDHFFASSNSRNGSENGTSWRRTSGSFSYQMKADGAKTIRLKGFGDRQSVLVSANGTAIGAFRFNREGLISAELPSSIKADKLTIEIAAEAGRETPRITEVRLCK